MILCTLASVSSLFAQQAIAEKSPKPAKTLIFLDEAHFELLHALPLPPAQNSADTRAELAEIHRIERARTPAQVAAAQFDDGHEDIFLYANVLGSPFKADALPLTFALSQHLRNDVGLIDGPLKTYFDRPRPYNFDATLHPVCPTDKSGSYPSGHSFNGYVYALVLTAMVPEKSTDILARADEFAHNRVVCEAHYPSDLEASRRAAYAMFGALQANPRFQAELAAAKRETRKALSLPAATGVPAP